MQKIEMIGSSHPYLKDLKKGKLESLGYFVVDDLGILQEDFAKKCEVISTIVCDNMIVEDSTAKVVEYYRSRAKANFAVSVKVYSGLVEKGNSAGIIAVLKVLQDRTLDEILDRGDLVLVLSKVEMAGNIGTLFRSSDATKCDLIINTGVRVNLNSNKVIHSSRGMVLSIPYVSLDTKAAVNTLRSHGYKIYTCETLDGISFDKADYSGKIAIVVGSERYGIEREWLDAADKNIYIPMFGNMHSLNVGVAGSLLLYEARMFKNKKS